MNTHIHTHRPPADYGALPVHAGLWDIGAMTRESLAARLALVPLVQEARGLGACGSDARAIIATNNSGICSTITHFTTRSIFWSSAGDSVTVF